MPIHLMLVAALLVPAAGAIAAQCRVLDPELQEAYAGPCVNGLAEGKGYARGRAEYEGELLAGAKHGRGVKSWPNGDRYEGEFENDRKQGRGVYTFGRGPSAGERYEGEFREDRRHGQGTYRWVSGDLYTGPWENDLATGPRTPMMLARAQFEAEARAAVAQPGRKVCRELAYGIGGTDWIRGVVLEVRESQVAIRIEDAGRERHLVGGVEVRPGLVLVDSPAAWIPCY
jgi:hypothetical protein